MEDISIHKKYIQRCIDLAYKAGKDVKGNPNVGAVLVHDGCIIGEGYHQQYGGPHAEVNAVNSVSEKDKHKIQSSRLYVSLEPCCIHRKTPPCTSLILKYKIPEVFISTVDPNSDINGEAVNLLRENGVTVTTSILDDEGKQLIRPFASALGKRSYIILKWAQSSDGYITAKGEQTRISNQYSDRLVHLWRSEVDGILVGHNTVLIDNPKLTVRHVPGDNPRPIVLTNNILDLKGTYLADESAGSLCYDGMNINEMLSDLYSKGIHRLLIEGGAKTHKRFIESGHWDEARIINNNRPLGKGIRAARVQGILMNSYDLYGDSIEILRKS